MHSSAELNEALDQARTWLKRNEGVSKLVEAVERIGSLQLAAEEAQASLSKINGEIEKAKADLETVSGQVQRACVERDRIIAEARTEARRLLDDALASAAEKTAEAGERAQATVAKAVADGEAMLAGAKRELAELKDSYAAGTKALGEVNIARAAAAGELERLEAKIATAREAIAKALS